MKVVMLTTDARECWRTYDRVDPYFGQPQEALLHAVPEFEDIEMHVVCCWQRPMPAPQKLASNIWFHGIVVPKVGWLRTAYQGCIRAVRRKIKEIKPDIVHGQGTERDCAICAVFSAIPNVVTIHGNMAALARLHRARVGSYLWCAGRLEDFTLKRTGGIFCNSAYTEALVRPRNPRTWRVPNPIRAEFFSTPPPSNLSHDCVLVNVGVIDERKRQLEILNLFGQLHAEGLAFELLFVGRADEQSPYAREFLNKIRLAEKAGYARYLGLKSGQELVECFDRAHGMVHFPSEESFGLVVAEGMARNLKFFGSRVGGIMEIASQADQAELFEANDWSALRAAIGRWIRQAYPRASSADQLMRLHYHPKVVMEQHKAIYTEFLSSCS